MAKHVKQSIKPGVLALALSLLLTGCGNRPVSGDQSDEPITGQGLGRPLAHESAADDLFTLNSDRDASFNPVTSGSALNLQLATLMYEPLFAVNSNFTVSPVLCTKIEMREEGKSYIFTIDTSRKFSDGSNLRPQDVRMSIWRAWSSAQYRDRLQVLFGIDNLSDNQVMVSLKYPNTQLPALLNIPIYKYESGNDDLPPGTGRYIMSEDRTQLTRNPDHPDFEKLPFETIYLANYTRAEDIITSFESARLDLVTNDPIGAGNFGYGNANEARYYATTVMHYLGYNLDSTIMRSTHLRYAMSFAVNRSHITTSIMGGSATAATLPISPISPLYSTQLAATLDFSPEKCADIFDAADVKDWNRDGYREIRTSGEPTELVIDFIVNNDNAVKLAAARDIARNLDNVGVNINLRELSWHDFTEALKKGNFDMYYGEIKLTPDFDLSIFFRKDGALRYSSTPDTGLIAQLDDYLRADDDSRRVLCERMCAAIADSAAITPIAFEKQEVLTHIGAIQNMVPGQYDLFANLTDWTVNIISR